MHAAEPAAAADRRGTERDASPGFEINTGLHQWLHERVKPEVGDVGYGDILDNVRNAVVLAETSERNPISAATYCSILRLAGSLKCDRPYK